MESYTYDDENSCNSDEEDQRHNQLFDSLTKILQKDVELRNSRTKQLIKAQPADSSSVPDKPPDLKELLNPTSLTPSIDNALLYNSACQQVLRQVEKQLLDSLEGNRKKQKEIIEYITLNKTEDDDDSGNLKIKCAGMPYFKDKEGFLPPWNNDVKKKIKNRELLPEDFIVHVGCWNKTEYQELERAVVAFVRNSRIEKLQTKKNDIAKADPNNQNDILAIESEIEEIKNKPSHLLNMNSNEIDWLRISSQHLKGKYSDFECEAKWNLELDPRINKSKWKNDETKNLLSLAKKYKYQDWDLIALKLNTNRSGYQCCVQYHSSCNQMEGKWTPEEDEKLKELVAKYKNNNYIPWVKIAWYFDSRSIRQCRERYMYSLIGTKKGHFDDVEDYMIVTKLKESGNNFAEVAKNFPDRSMKQIRARYDYLVGVNMDPFSPEEEDLLIRLVHQHSKNWKLISSCFENRSALQCRKAWEKIGRPMTQKNPDDDSGSEDNFPEDFPLTLEPTDDIDIDIAPEKLTKNTRKSSGISQKSSSTSRVPYEESIVGDESEQTAPFRSLLKYLKTGHEFSYGPKHRILKTQDETDKSTSKMTAIMSMLGVNCDFSSKLETVQSVDNCEYNSEDRMILKRLCETEGADSNAQFVYKNLIPPNYTTLVGLRSLILGRDNIQNSIHEYIPENTTVSDPISPNDRLLFTDSKLLFRNRLKSLFAVPIACSLTNPDTIPKLVVKNKTKRNKSLSRKRKKDHSKKMTESKKSSKESNSDDLQSETDSAITEGNIPESREIFQKRGRPRKTDPIPIENISLRRTRRTISSTSTKDEQNVFDRSLNRALGHVDFNEQGGI